MASEEASPKPVQTRDSSAALEAMKRHPLVTVAARLALAILPAVAASLVAFTGAGQIAEEKSQVTKDKAEAGFQVTLDTLRSLREETRRLETRLVRLDAELSAVKKAIKKNAPKIRVPAAPPVVAAPAPAPALPPNLDAALEIKAPKVAP